MALVKCPECGKEISNIAKVCPNCGYRNKRGKKLDRKQIIVFAIFLLIIGGIFFTIKNISRNMPKGLTLTLDMTKEDVHDKIGDDFVLEKGVYGQDIEVYDLKWCGYDGKLSITYLSGSEKIEYWNWEIDTSDMSSQDVENAMIKIRDKISNIHGTPEESNGDRLDYEWVTTHTVKNKVTKEVGYKLIRDDSLWLHYGVVY